jgi:putative transposase
MQRSSKYSLKFATKKKRELLNRLFEVYIKHLQKTVDLMWNKEIPIRKAISSKQIYWMDDLGGQYKDLIYKQASEIVRSCRFIKGRKSKPIVKNFTINFDYRMVIVEKSSNSFDKWIRLRLPFIKENKKKERIEILIPIKEHRHSLKFKDWRRCANIKLSKNYVSFAFEKETPKVKEKGKTVGIDQGYKNLIVTSDGESIGKNFYKVYEKISRKRQKSKAFERALKERDNESNRLINILNLNPVKEIVVEDLKSVKHKSKFSKKFNNKFQHWTYTKVVNKLAMLCEENRVLFTKVDPAYTSQKCSKCGFIHKDNRNKDTFLCISCGNLTHADLNAAVNLSQLGAFSPQSAKSFTILKEGEEQLKCPKCKTVEMVKSKNGIVVGSLKEGTKYTFYECQKCKYLKGKEEKISF